MGYTEWCVDCDISVRDAMKKLDATGSRILFVMKGDKIFATLSDGDVRRFLLTGGRLDETVASAANQNFVFAKNRSEAINIFKNNRYDAVPIVDSEGRLKGAYHSHDKGVERYKKLDIPTVIMAGGKGTRLEPFTKILPKPLIPVGDLPIIEHIMLQFEKFGCNDFHLIVNHKKQLIKTYFAECERNYNASFYDEDKPLGTGGGLSLLKGRMDSTFFLVNCDILLQSNYEDMLEFHRTQKNVVTMVCVYKNLTIPYGVIEIDDCGKILSMKEKPELSFLTNTGMYIVEPEVLEDIPEDTMIGFPDIVEMQRKKGKNVGVFPVVESEWLDMGQMNELEKMRKKLYGE